MCDAMSFVSAWGSFQSGKAAAYTAQAEGITALGNAMFEASQLITLNVLETAKVRNDEGEMIKEFGEQAKQNASAAAVSGLDPSSFDSIQEGNIENMRDAMGQMETDLAVRKSQRKGQAKLRQMEGMVQHAAKRAEAKAAMFSGIMGAVDALYGAEQSYQKNNTGQSRGGYFFKSIGVGG